MNYYQPIHQSKGKEVTMYKRKLRHVLLVFSLVLCLPAFANAQSELVIPSSDGTTFLNEQILADAGRPADRVYVLQKNGTYYMHTALRNDGFVLRIRAEAGAGQKPVIYLVANPTTGTFPVAHFVCAEDVILKDLILVGFFEAVASEIGNIPPRLIDTAVPGVDLIIDGCILTNERGEHIRVAQTAAARVVKITNSIFSNMGDLGRSNLGAGRALDLRNTSLDSLVMVNNTFVNFHDRIVRHYQSVASIRYFLFDHNTVVNGLSYHSMISLGFTGDEAIITNNLFVDNHIAGADTDAVRQAEFGEPGELDPRNGKGRIVWILAVPNDSTQWTASGNYYSVSPEVQAFYDQYASAGVLGEGSPLNWHVNRKLGADSVNAFKKESITLTNRPTPMLAMAHWYRDPAGANKTKSTTNFVRALHDYDRRPWQYFADTLKCTYPTTTAAYTADRGLYPAGDLNWYPDKKAQWEGGGPPPQLITIDGQKDDFYNTLTGPNDGYLQIKSYAFNDNGIPTGDADLSAKVWTAWDDKWFYLYEEVMDDTLAANATNVWEEDEIELKFDPQPTDSVTNSVWDTRLTTFGQGTGVTAFDNMNNVPDSLKQYVRTVIPGGYALELAIKWSAIRSSNAETITPAAGNVFGMAINNHDNDGRARRQASVMWAATMLDAVWNTPKYHGTVKFLDGNKLQFIPQNNVATNRINKIPYDGTPFYMRIDGRRDPFFASLAGPNDGYLQVKSYAFNDNGIPTGDADLSAKVWTAWDDKWFYLYEEVKDDTVAANATNVWEEDEIELKFDPQPTDSVTNSVWDTRLTALGQGTGVTAFDNLGNVPDSLKQYVRTRVSGGYNLELAIRWSAIRSSNNETITPAAGNVFGMAINNHDNDGRARRQASIMWAATMLDAVWNTPKYHGTVKFLDGNKLQFIPKNNVANRTNNIPYDGTPFFMRIDGRKDPFFSSLAGPDNGYLQIRSYADNDNGRPVSDADLSAKVWTAWDDKWFYLYEEVRDDTVAANATNVWEEDTIELKFDPQPTDSTQAGASIFDTRLTALGQGTGVVAFDNMNNIPDSLKQYIRTRVTGGYNLELAIRWSAIRSGNAETVTPAVDNIFGMAIMNHDNDGRARRQASVEWAAVMLDAVWNTPKYHGTVKFLAANKLQYIPQNNMTKRTNNVPYDGRDVPVSVDQDPVASIPSDFELGQNYPNPFNPSTKIQYALKQGEYVSLRIYNIMGHLVATLVDEKQLPGRYNVQWDGRDDRGQLVSTGIYFYRIQAGSFTQIRKMALVK
jgi:hypothetical protein